MHSTIHCARPAPKQMIHLRVDSRTHRRSVILHGATAQIALQERTLTIVVPLRSHPCPLAPAWSAVLPSIAPTRTRAAPSHRLIRNAIWSGGMILMRVYVGRPSTLSCFVLSACKSVRRPGPPHRRRSILVAVFSVVILTATEPGIQPDDACCAYGRRRTQS